MIGVARDATVNASNPLLDVYVLIGGLLAAPFEARYAIFDVSDDDKLLAPVQVFPTTPNTTQAVNLSTGRVSTGRYAATWTVAGNEPLGRHEIRWFVTPEDGAPVVTIREEFDVLIGALNGAFNAYALPSDLREEGFLSTDVSDARLQRALLSASERIERITRRFFEPRMLNIKLDGTSSTSLRFNMPIIAVESIAYEETIAEIDSTRLRVYNRHLSGLTSPDDRDDPRIEWTNWERPFIWRFVREPTRVWNKGRQNVLVSGLFGYTDPDGTFAGSTPRRIREAAKMLAARDLPKIADGDKVWAKIAHRITSDTTRDQSQGFDPDRRVAEFTGDPEIDAILCDYMAPPFVGST